MIYFWSLLLAISVLIFADRGISAGDMAGRLEANSSNKSTFEESDAGQLGEEPMSIRFITNRGQKLEHYFPYLLLKLALTKNGKSFELNAVYFEDYGIRQSQSYLMKFIDSNEVFDVQVAENSVDRENHFIAVYFPIYRGLSRYHLLTIRDADQERFDQVGSVEDLKEFISLTAASWIDNDILRHQGFKVVTGEYQNVAKMLRAGNGDFMTRSIPEFIELDPKTFENITFEEGLLMEYPVYYYFYVRSGEHEIHNAIANGLAIALADGSYERLFNEQILTHEIWSQFDINTRRSFTLENHFFSRPTANLPDHLFYNWEDVQRIRAGFSKNGAKKQR